MPVSKASLLPRMRILQPIICFFIFAMLSLGTSINNMYSRVSSNQIGGKVAKNIGTTLNERFVNSGVLSEDKIP